MRRMFGGSSGPIGNNGGSPGAGAGSGKGNGLLSTLMGGREPRYNRLLDKMSQSTILFKVPTDWGVDENNVALGTGAVAPAGGATVTSTVSAPRDLILRKLILVNQALITDIDFTVSAVTVEGNATILGNAIAGSIFLPNSFHSPSWDLPVAGGTSVSVTIVNGSAAVQRFSPVFTID